VSPVKQRLGYLLHELDPSDQRLMDGPRDGTPVVGSVVHLWRLPGTWSVRASGPTQGTWWLQACDTAAEAVLTELHGHPDRGLPDVTHVYGTPHVRAVAVTSKAIRAGGR